MTQRPELIETMRLAHGEVALWPEHRLRLTRSAKALGYPLAPIALDALLARTCAAQDAAGTWRLRLLVAADGGMRIEAYPLSATAQPVSLRLARAPLVADAFWLAHKSTRRPWYATAQVWLSAHPEVFDVIYGNAHGELCEGSRTNVYLRDAQGVWLTPPLDSGLLPGVQRQALLDAGRVREARISLADLRDAPLLRVSNALRGWLDARLGGTIDLPDNQTPPVEP